MRLVIFAVGIAVGIAASLLYLSQAVDEFGRTYDGCLRDQQLAVLESATVEALGTAEHIAKKRCDLVWEPVPERTVDADPSSYECITNWGFSNDAPEGHPALKFAREELTSDYSYETGRAPWTHGIAVNCRSSTEARKAKHISVSVTIDGDPWQQVTLNGGVRLYGVNFGSTPGSFNTRLDLGRPMTNDHDVQFVLEAVKVVENEGERQRVK